MMSDGKRPPPGADGAAFRVPMLLLLLTAASFEPAWRISPRPPTALPPGLYYGRTPTTSRSSLLPAPNTLETRTTPVGHRVRRCSGNLGRYLQASSASKSPERVADELWESPPKPPRCLVSLAKSPDNGVAHVPTSMGFATSSEGDEFLKSRGGLFPPEATFSLDTAFRQTTRAPRPKVDGPSLKPDGAKGAKNPVEPLRRAWWGSGRASPTAARFGITPAPPSFPVDSVPAANVFGQPADRESLWSTAELPGNP